MKHTPIQKEIQAYKNDFYWCSSFEEGESVFLFEKESNLHKRIKAITFKAY